MIRSLRMNCVLLTCLVAGLVSSAPAAELTRLDVQTAYKEPVVVAYEVAIDLDSDEFVAG